MICQHIPRAHRVADLKIEVDKKRGMSPSDLRFLVIERDNRTAERFGNLALDGFSVIESTLTRCVFERVRARSASLGEGSRQSVFEECTFSHCKLVFGAVGNVRLVRCRFESCRLKNIFGTDLEMVECDFPNTVIKKGAFHGNVTDSAQFRPRRSANEFRNNDFSGATMEDVDFRGGIDLHEQKLPTGADYVFIADTCKALDIARELQTSIEDNGERMRSNTLVSLLDFYSSHGQNTQLMRLDPGGEFERAFRARLSTRVR